MQDLNIAKLTITTTPQAWEALMRLKDTGLFGGTCAEVAERLICRALVEESRPNGLLRLCSTESTT